MNKSEALDKHKADIKKYLGMRLSLSAIAKLLEAAKPTVNDYIKRCGLRVCLVELNVEEKVNMKIKDLISKLSKLNQEDEIICFDESREIFENHHKTYLIMDVKIMNGHKEKLHLLEINGAFREAPDGAETPILIISSDF